YCSEIEFGTVNLSDGEKEFCSEWNNEIISLCKSLPQSTQTDALLFFMRYSGISFSEELNFFRTYYIPTWSIIYWLLQSGLNEKGLDQTDIRNAKTAHSMAMFLHALDDHLKDSEMPVTHLALLLRSQSWMIMNNALNNLADGVDGGEEVVRGFIDDYYSSIRASEEIQSLDSYCDLFRKQMATGYVVPVLIIIKMTTNKEFTSAIQTAYGSFGIAWRLLDDIKDIKTDMMKGIHSSVYICLSEDIKNCWDKDTGEKIEKNSGRDEVILDYVLENSVIDRIKERICSELELAASIADRYNMTGLADEFRCMLRPLKNRQGHI
ncbi:class 1 isoprenoid biosynthesis enzyme, partial [bacterium]|nr:class 1 isoprenoid biosynthesis enzyme [bacterium]